MISVLQAKDTQGQPCVAIVLRADSMFTTVEGDPLPGAALTPANARELAYQVLLIAQRIENGKVE